MTNEQPHYPKHVAIIMDGNGRWAERHNKSRSAGHSMGAKRAVDIAHYAASLPIQQLTLFALSCENLGRPEMEVAHLIQLLSHHLSEQRDEMAARRIRLRVIGDLEFLPADVIDLIKQCEDESKDNSDLVLNIAVNFSGQWHITKTIELLHEQGLSGQSDAFHDALNQINGETVPMVDLMIRTSMEQRISNFMLWHLSYAELYFIDTLWPEFDDQAFELALDAYLKRERRYGLHEQEAAADVA